MSEPYLILVLLVLLVVLLYLHSPLAAGSISLLLAALGISQTREHFLGLPPSPGDNYSASPYANVATDELDMSQQELTGNEGDLAAGLDNADVIEDAISRGVSLYPTPQRRILSEYRPYNPITHEFGQIAESQYDQVLTGKQNIDEMLARKQHQRGQLNKRAIEGASRATRSLYDKYFREELDENEKRVWWSAESDLIEKEWVPW